MLPIVRWTIGKTTKSGYECLQKSIDSVVNKYEVEPVICFNCEETLLPNFIKKYRLVNQKDHLECMPKPMGVAWKLYPPRLDINRHELAIDNDVILVDHIDEITSFFNNDCTLLLEDQSRTYGRFQKHVPLGFKINSGIYGMPPNFNLKKYIDFYVGSYWEKNALYEHDKNETFDEQGLVAIALLDYKKYSIIPNTTITNCEHNLVKGKGYHFIGLNRKPYHGPYQLFVSLDKKLFL